MASLTGKAPKNFYQDLLQMDNTNSGVSTGIQVVKDGGGNHSALWVSDDNVRVQPENDNGTATFQVRSQGGSQTLLECDTTNDQVKLLGNYANTQVQSMMVRDVSPSAGQHYPMPLKGGLTDASGANWGFPTGFGTGTDPATTLTLATPHDYLPCYMFLIDSIVIDQVRVVASSDNTSTSTLNFHIYQYTIDTSTSTGSGSTAGDLSSGALIAHNGSVLTVDSYGIYTTTLTIDDSTVTGSKVLLGFIEAVTINGDITAEMQIKYHLE